MSTRPSIKFTHGAQPSYYTNSVQTREYVQTVPSQTNTATFYRQSNVQPVIANNVVVNETREKIIQTPVINTVHTPTPIVFTHSSNPVIVQTRTIQQQHVTSPVVIQQKRFQTYQNPVANNYKYNLFSAIDEPWNRCLELGKCGKCPGNQFIATQLTRKFWEKKV